MWWNSARMESNRLKRLFTYFNILLMSVAVAVAVAFAVAVAVVVAVAAAVADTFRNLAMVISVTA